jgi:hypothetical protein
VPDNEFTYFKISPSASNSSADWQLTPLPNASEAVSGQDFRVSFASSEQLASDQQKRLPALPAGGSEFEVKRKSDRISFAGREIVLQCAPADRDEKLSLLKDFCRVFSRVEVLEKQVFGLLKSAKDDSAFTGKVDQSLLPDYERLSGKNRESINARIEFAELKRALFQAEDASDDEKLFTELCEASGLEERIELLDDEIEVAEEVYGVCIDRLSEFSYFWREFKAELWIILILVVELIEFCVDLAVQLK